MAVFMNYINDNWAQSLILSLGVVIVSYVISDVTYIIEHTRYINGGLTRGGAIEWTINSDIEI